MDDKKNLEVLVMHVENMRAAQREYFKTRTKKSLDDSVAFEKRVDAACKHLKSQGYDPDKWRPKEQSKLI